MKIALYGDDEGELRELEAYLKQCGKELLRIVDVSPFMEHLSFCEAIKSEEKRFDLLVVAQNGTFGLEIMDMIKARNQEIGVLWFSDLDFAVKSYEYGALWFGRKPVQLADIRKAFRRISVNR